MPLEVIAMQIANITGPSVKHVKLTCFFIFLSSLSVTYSSPCQVTAE